MNISLETPVEAFPRIGKKTAALLKKMDIATARDVLFCYPSRYEDFRHIIPVSQIMGNTYACIKAKVTLISVRRSPRKRISLAEAIVEDDTGSIKAIWFNQPYLSKTLHEGDELFIAGKVDMGKYGIQFVNPVFERVSSSPTHTARVVPVYALTQGVTQKMLRALVKAVLPLAKHVHDPIPENIRKAHGFMPLSEALKIIHFPITAQHGQQARERLAYQELITLHIELAKKRLVRKKERARSISLKPERVRQLLSALPFKLTQAQHDVLQSILHDIGQPFPMNRLINGDVGSGKTILIHILATLLADAGLQTAFLVPTDILAQQHGASYAELFPKEKGTVAVFTRTTRTLYSKTGKHTTTKKEILEAIAHGKVLYIIGTHALIQKDVEFAALDVVVIDEQHRFGVAQRATLPLATKKEKGYMPHFLSLTATPIPRSLARIVFGGGDVSIIDTKPKERKPITTVILSEHDRGTAYDNIKHRIKRGEQAFIICPIIEESDTLGVKAATQEYDMLKETVFSRETISLLHGKQRPTLRDEIMSKFVKNEISILVATAVVEVGVDVPNATVMLIEGAERFGLAQLHQFRGRIGRGNVASTCFAVQSSDAEKAKDRLRAFAKTTDGFALSEFDLEQRGPGAVFGTKQSGFLPLRLADITNTAFVKKAQDIAKEIILSYQPKI